MALSSLHDDPKEDAPAPVPERDSTTQRRVPPWLEQTGAWSWRVVALGLALYLFGRVLVALHLAVLPVVIGLILSSLLEPLVRLLRKAHVPKFLAALIAMLLGLGVVAGIVVLVVFGASDQLSKLSEDLESGYRALVDWVAHVGGVSREHVRTWVDDQLLEVQSLAGKVTEEAVVRVAGFFRGLSVAVLTVVFMLFFLWNGDEQFESLVRLAPVERRVTIRRLGLRVWETVGAYMKGIVQIATADAVLLGIGLWIIGLPMVVPLMLLMFLGALVPFLGPLIAGSVAALVGLSYGGPTMALLVVVVVLVVQQIEGNLLQPFIMGHAVRLHPAAVLFAVTAGAVLAGIAGLFLAVPIAASAMAVLEHFRDDVPEEARDGSS